MNRNSVKRLFTCHRLQRSFIGMSIAAAITLNAPLQASQTIDPPKIQIAILLDTSNSMDGLIDQTRNQLWQVVNEFSSVKQDGVTPILEIALFEYGNDSNPASAGHVRQLSQFTRELDAVSEGLFSLDTNGGSEFSGYAIKTAVDSLQWSRSESDIKTIFIAGNESFDQGPVSYRQAIEMAASYGISINTIHAGTYQEGIDDAWKNAALLAGGEYLSIDANQQVVHIEAPQDEEIAALNDQLNQTYIPYGNDGAVKLERQLKQDALSSDISSGLLAKRAKSKSSSFYRNSTWDLVDAFKDGEVDQDALTQLEEESLPEPMQGLSATEKLGYVQDKADQRARIQQRISDLSLSRDVFVAEKKQERVAAAPSIGDALTEAVRKEASRKNFIFE